MRRLSQTVIGLIFSFGAALAQADTPPALPSESPPVIISVDADSNYFVNDDAVESIAALHSAIVAATARPVMPRFYLWSDEDNRAG